MATTDATPWYEARPRELTELERRKINAIARNLAKKATKALTAYLQRRAAIGEGEVVCTRNNLECFIQSRERALEDGCEILEVPEPAKPRRRK